MPQVRLTVDYPTYIAIRTLLWNVRLGNRNVFEEGVGELMEEMEASEGETFEDAVQEYGIPSIHVEFNDAEGMVINLVAEE